jgi:hypothetical protein
MVSFASEIFRNKEREKVRNSNKFFIIKRGYE